MSSSHPTKEEVIAEHKELIIRAIAEEIARFFSNEPSMFTQEGIKS